MEQGIGIVRLDVVETGPIIINWIQMIRSARRPLTPLGKSGGPYHVSTVLLLSQFCHEFYNSKVKVWDWPCFCEILCYFLFYTDAVFALLVAKPEQEKVGSSCLYISTKILVMACWWHQSIAWANADFCEEFMSQNTIENSCPGLSELTHWGQDYMAAVFRRQFQMHFLEWKCMNFD